MRTLNDACVKQNLHMRERPERKEFQVAGEVRLFLQEEVSKSLEMEGKQPTELGSAVDEVLLLSSAISAISQTALYTHRREDKPFAHPCSLRSVFLAHGLAA